jgi:hypothetical protein
MNLYSLLDPLVDSGTIDFIFIYMNINASLLPVHFLLV